MIDEEPFPGSPDDMMNTIATLRARVAQREAALAMMIEAEVDYMERNNLGDPEKQHRVIVARAALKDAPP